MISSHRKQWHRRLNSPLYRISFPNDFTHLLAYCQARFLSRESWELHWLRRILGRLLMLLIRPIKHASHWQSSNLFYHWSNLYPRSRLLESAASMDWLDSACCYLLLPYLPFSFFFKLPSLKDWPAVILQSDVDPRYFIPTFYRAHLIPITSTTAPSPSSFSPASSSGTS